MGEGPKKKVDFDPEAYIESAFLSTKSADSDSIPSLDGYIDLGGAKRGANGKAKVAARFKKTQMRAPRPRRASDRPIPPPIEPELKQVWENMPKNVEFLIKYFDDGVTANYYDGDFKESRQDLIKRLLDPEISLEETSRLLGVCPATVRRYTNRGWLNHHRTPGGQRRFKLSDVVKFVEHHGRFPEG